MDDIFSIWDEDYIENIPFYGSPRDLTILTKLVANCLNKLETSANPREMVLETWLAVDFTVRQFLLSGFELNRFCDEDFDLGYILLPSSFSELLRHLKSVVKYNAKFSLEPDSPRPDKTGGFRASSQFWAFIKNKHKSLLDKIQRVQREYVLEMNPELTDKENIAYFSTASSISLNGPKTNVKKMHLEWRKAASKLDEYWFILAENLNTARNIAAHNVDAAKIGRPFGLTGDNLTELIRKKCRLILKGLLSVKVEDK